MRARLESTVLAILCTVTLVGPASAQLIPIKTVPVATGDQFLVFPSDRLGMGSVSIAVRDSVGDPFTNPAMLRHAGASRLFAAPTGYGITGGNGGAMTLPAGAFLRSETWSGGFALAFQDLDRGEAAQPFIFPVFADVAVLPPAPNELGQRSRSNLYAFAAIARSLGQAGRTSIGASFSVADLSALSGVDLLYSRRTVDQRGSLVDLRFGMETAWGDQALEAVLVHTRFEMEHDLVDVVWTPIEQPDLPPDQWPWGPVPVERTELDETSTWGLHLDYTRPLEDGWGVGAVLTANYKSHPKLPNYTLMSIPRDPGDSWAYDLGIGLHRTTDSSEFGVDLVFEPVWTETWADAAGPVATVGGDTIPAGDMTVYNDFRFTNAILRTGLGGDLSERLRVQLGLQLKRYGYTLDQTDFVAERRRRQRESWIEWTPSLSLAVRFEDFSIRYAGRIITGTGRPGVSGGRVFAVAEAAAFDADFLPAPSSALTLEEAMVHTHQVTVSIPLGP